jgi:toxin CcdB
LAQFDVHRNTGRLRDTVPFVVIVQSSPFDRYLRRVVVPPVKADLADPIVVALDEVFTRAWR